MKSFGAYLRTERQLRQVSLPEISAAIRVRQDFLEALENDSYRDLPTLTHVKGYVRSYADFIGLDPDEAVVNFEYHLLLLDEQELPPEWREKPAAPPPPPSRAHRRRWIWLIPSILVLAGALVAGWFAWPGTASAPLPQVAAGTPALPYLQLVVSATSGVWVKVVADSGQPRDAYLEPGAKRQFRAKERFLVTVGDAQAVRVTLNDRPYPVPPAKEGGVSSFKVTLDDLSRLPPPKRTPLEPALEQALPTPLGALAPAMPD